MNVNVLIFASLLITVILTALSDAKEMNGIKATTPGMIQKVKKRNERNQYLSVRQMAGRLNK